MECQLAELVVDTLARINEEASDDDYQAVTDTLQVIENVIEMHPPSAVRFAKEKLLTWLFKRVRGGKQVGANTHTHTHTHTQDPNKANEVITLVDHNRAFAAEILIILLQNAEGIKDMVAKPPIEGVDRLLRALAVYRKKDPGGVQEEEFCQNAFDALCSLLLVQSNKKEFGKRQGVELAIRMMRERRYSSAPALKLANYALSNHTQNCMLFVDKQGLKTLFSWFMIRGFNKKKYKKQQLEDEEHILSIIQSLLRHCNGTAQGRVCNKFIECEGEKIQRLLELHRYYKDKVSKGGDTSINNYVNKDLLELGVYRDEQLYLDRCERGLATLQLVDLIIVRIANMGMSSLSGRLMLLMDVKGVHCSEVVGTVSEYCEHLSESAEQERTTLRNFMTNFLRQKDDLLPD
eukprot:GHVR01049494.1.p1 GENE.GHVR01049494.1~~GHVR01049494.1.p1  ORF type:complete len:405 (+),score=100.39 GHVR01049494.1:590-1804(+)